MYTLFNISKSIQFGTFTNPNLRMVRDTIQRGLVQYINYYNTHVFSTKSNHLLVTLLHSLNVDLKARPHIVYDQVNNNLNALSMALKFTSSLQQGKIFNNIFYGKQSSEIIISDTEAFNPDLVYKNWQNVVAVEVLQHDRTNLALSPLNGSNDSYPDSELAVIYIDIVKLALQYKGFLDFHPQNKTEDPFSPMQFISMYVLPNMMYSHLDWVVFNRLYYLLNRDFSLSYEIELQSFKSNTPFFQTDYTKRLDDILISYLDRLYTGKYRFDNMLEILPVITEISLADIVKLPKIIPTRQVKWALVISRLKVLELLFTISKINESTLNNNELNNFKRQYQFYKSDNAIKYALPNTLSKKVLSTLDTLRMLSL